MSSLRKRVASLSVAALAAVPVIARPAAADTYQLDYVSTSNSNIDRAVYADGSVMVYGSTCLVTGGGPCYRTYDHGEQTSVSSVQPTLATDNGSACSFSVAGIEESGRCNGNYEAFSISGSDPLAKFMTPGVYAGALDDPTLVYSDPYQNIAALFLNGTGDVVFEDTGSDEIWQGYDTTPTPEPGTMLLVLSGAGVGLVGVRRIAG